MKRLTGFIGILLLAGCAGRDPQPAFIQSSPSSSAFGIGTNTLANLSGKHTVVGDYDAAVVKTINQKWDEILHTHRFDGKRTGKVVVQFHLHPDGTVSDMKISENHAGALLGFVCEEAIRECGPLGPWPPDMVRMVGADYREISFTFYYN